MGIGGKIKELRQRRGITQETLALKIGVTPSAVGNYERNISFPKEEVLMKLFGALECTPNELLGTDGTLTQIELPPQLLTHLDKYRALDDRGREIVDACTENELQRVCAKYGEIPIAARKGSSNEQINLKKRSGKSILDLPDYKGGRK